MHVFQGLVTVRKKRVHSPLLGPIHDSMSNGGLTMTVPSPLTKRTNRNQGVFLPWRREQKTIYNHYSHWLTGWWLAPFPWKQRAEQKNERLFRIIEGFCVVFCFLKIKPARCLHSLSLDLCTVLWRSQSTVEQNGKRASAHPPRLPTSQGGLI